MEQIIKEICNRLFLFFKFDKNNVGIYLINGNSLQEIRTVVINDDENYSVSEPVCWPYLPKQEIGKLVEEALKILDHSSVKN